MRISDWSSDVCSSDLSGEGPANRGQDGRAAGWPHRDCRRVEPRTESGDRRDRQAVRWPVCASDEERWSRWVQGKYDGGTVRLVVMADLSCDIIRTFRPPYCARRRSTLSDVAGRGGGLLSPFYALVYRTSPPYR